MMTIILTGFTPFPGVAINPAQVIVERIASDPAYQPYIITEILPTVFQTAGERLRALIRQHHPDVVICLGVAAGRKKISLERFALNINDASKPDNSGLLAQGQPIIPDGQHAYRSTLPLEQFYTAIDSLGIPVEYSNYAGAYVCNHVFYTAQHEIDCSGLNTRAGFIHIPMMTEANAEEGLPIDTMTAAIKACLATLTQR
ncbi:MAG: pyroglutamyl-peptidase I [Chloroflexi bacterium]|nr:MAG: pyroglutamyl-peptidase I [Chloroflexota bacterium]